MMVIDRHADRGIGIHHLLGGDDFELMAITIQAKVFGDPPDFLVVILDGLMRPFGIGRRTQRILLAHRYSRRLEVVMNYSVVTFGVARDAAQGAAAQTVVDLRPAAATRRCARASPNP